MLHRDGFKGIAPLPLAIRKPATEPPYLTDGYFDLYRTMLEELALRDMELILYDDNDFPSGTAGGRMKERYPQMLAKRLVRIDTLLTGGGLKSVEAPSGTLMSACLSKPEKKDVEVVTDRIKRGGDHTWQIELPDGQWRLQVFICHQDAETTLVDFLDPEAVGKLTELTYDEYYKRFPDYFGSTIRTSFYDDLAYWQVPGAMAWTDEFNRKFEKKHGFTPEALYPSLFEDTGENTAVNRILLFGFRDRLFAEGYPRVISQWAAKHRIACSGHPAATYRPNPLQNMGDGLLYFKHQDVPLCDYIHYFRHGVDGFNIPASAAYNYDKELLICEIYGNFQPDDYNDGDMLYRAAMDVYARGINRLLPHGTWYDAGKVSIIPEISWRNPKMAGRLKGYNEWTARCETILQNSRHVAQVGILYPIADLQARYNVSEYKISNGREYIKGNGYYDLLGLMTKKVRTDYTLIHPEVLDERCVVKPDGILRLDNPNNHEEYRLLIVPWSKTIHASNLAKIKDFADRGGIVLFAGCLPEQSAEKGRNEQVKQFVGELVQNPHVHFIEKPDERNMKEFIEKQLADPFVRISQVKVTATPDTNRMALPDTFRDADYAYNCIHKVKDGMDFFFFGNPTDCALSAEISFKAGKNSTIELWNPHDGTIETCPSRNEGGRIYVTLPLPPVESRFIVLR
jgi:hypothetical protein